MIDRCAAYFIHRKLIESRIGLRETIMKKLRHWMLISLFLSELTGITGCAIFNLPKDPGAVLFQDDFSSPNSGWDRYHGEMYESDYSDGGYRIAVFQENQEAWALPGLDFSDVIIEVVATKISGPSDDVYGVLCRYVDPRNFYFFLISSDGYAGVGLNQDGERRLLSGETMLPSDSIVQGTSTNSFHIECVGNRLSLSVNNDVIYEIQSSALRSGDVGLIAGTYEHAGTEVLFDNFSVRNP
jgi:hypothetical protein